MPVEALPCWQRQTRMPDLSAPLSTRIGAVAFQWWSIRHRSLHAATLETCPMSVLLAQLGDSGQAARVLHDRQHAEPHNSAVARDLLDALEALVRSRPAD